MHIVGKPCITNIRCSETQVKLDLISHFCPSLNKNVDPHRMFGHAVQLGLPHLEIFASIILLAIPALLRVLYSDFASL